MARILLAEDDDQMRAFLSRGLKRAGHAVDAVPDGEAALLRLQAGEYDLLLADVVMPGIDGIELARRVAAARDRGREQDRERRGTPHGFGSRGGTISGGAVRASPRCF